MESINRRSFLKSSFAAALAGTGGASAGGGNPSVLETGVAKPPAPPRNRRPCAGLDWSKCEQVPTTSHGRCTCPAHLDIYLEHGYRFLAISNYYPSAPTVPLKDFGANILIVPELTVHECLKAYRLGNFYCSLHSLGELKFTGISFDGKTVTASTDKPAKGMNMLVIDIGEGLVFPSHPELAIRGSWTPDRLRAEIARLNALGLEVIPKLNFSTTHNGWLKQYRHQLYTPKYYQVCEDLIRDVCEIFNHPRLFHIGCDEESARHQEQSRRSSFILVRRGEFWWHDFFHLIATCEKNGTRPWAWPDFAWDNPEYYDRCPKSVLQCTWYYDEEHGGFDLSTNKTGDLKRLMEFVELEKRGFDQTPCGTNWVGWVRKAHKVDADDVIGKLVRFARENIAPERLKGFMMASWAACDTREDVDFLKRGVDLFAASQFA